jgi:cell division septation protein DedD
MKIRGAVVGTLLALVALIEPAGVRAQALDRVEELVRLGRTEDARTVLQEWWSAERDGAPQRDQQRGLWLRGRLTTDPSLAELDFQRLVVLYPSSPYAPQALLRLAQSAHAHGDGAGAERHVASIVRDYPASSVRAEAEAWLRAAGTPPPALEAARPSTTPPRQAPTTTQPASSQPAATPTQSTPSAPSGGPPEIRPATPRPPAPADEALDWSVQFGAFVDQDRAFALHGQLFDAGLAARLVRVAGSGFLHVRIGRFATRAEASQELQRVTALGYTAALVRDDRAEELVRR